MAFPFLAAHGARGLKPQRRGHFLLVASPLGPACALPALSLCADSNFRIFSDPSALYE